MKIFSVFGVSGAGKTTTIEAIIRELINRGYSVGSIKDIHFEQFAIDTPGTNTSKHKKAGANPVTARGLNETDVMFDRQLSITELLHFYRQDYVVLEGVSEPDIPMILTANSVDELNRLITPFVFAVSGRIASKINSYNGLPAVDATANISALTDLAEKMAKEWLDLKTDD